MPDQPSCRGAPRGHFRENVLTDLLAAHASVPRKRVTLLCRILPPGEASSVVERDIGMLVTGTVLDGSQVDAMDAAIDNAAPAAKIALRHPRASTRGLAPAG